MQHLVFPIRCVSLNEGGYVPESILLVADVLGLCGIEEKVADGCNQRINTECHVGKDKVCQSSGGVAFRLEAGMVDDKAADPTKEKRQKKTNEIVVVVHEDSLLKM